MFKFMWISILPMLFSSCTWLHVFSTTAEIIEHYPSDNFIEDEIVEPFLEKRFGLEEDSLDISIFSPEEK